MLQRFGFFEDSPETARHDLELLRNLGPLAQEGAVLNYLRSGTRLLEANTPAYDRLGETLVEIGAPHVLTDGEWCWSADVIYYIDRYHIAIEPRFVDWMNKHHWICPRVVSAQAIVQANWLT